MRRFVAVLVAALALPAAANGHYERPVAFPDHLKGAVPPYRPAGPSLVVCKPDSRARIAKLPAAARRRNNALLPRCRYEHVQAAVGDAQNGMRILVLPGVYREEPSRAAPSDDPRCTSMRVPAFAVPQVLVASYEQQLACPNRRVNSYGIWVHDSRFHHNATGISMDSVGTGPLIAGGNANTVEGNWFYDNWRYGAMLFWVPAFIRGENDPALHYDTSHGNRFAGNRMGRRPGGLRGPNGLDFWWDEEGRANCWERNGSVRSNPVALPSCLEPREFAPPKPKFTQLVACANWNPQTNTDPIGCNWPARPRRPR